MSEPPTSHDLEYLAREQRERERERERGRERGGEEEFCW
jgi:hypothetical protein